MLKAKEAELRRAAALACAMKDDKGHVPDLIDALTDADDAVVRAAKAGLKRPHRQRPRPRGRRDRRAEGRGRSRVKDWYAKEKK